MKNTTPCITVPVIRGDGIGPEIWDATQPVLEAAIAQSYSDGRRIDWLFCLAGQAAFDATGDYLPASTMAAIQSHKLAIKAPLSTPVGEGIRSLNVTLRKTFDLYACVRPVSWFPGVPSPVCHPERVDMVIFRENTEDIYAGIEWAYDTPAAAALKVFIQEHCGSLSFPFPDTTAFGIKPVSKQGSERLIGAAIDYALAHKRSSVTLVHKGNIMKYTEGGFLRWGYELAEARYADKVFTWRQYEVIAKASGKPAAEEALLAAKVAGRLIIKDQICDAFFQESLIRPETFDVVATLNLNGDYISDALAAQVGGIGMSPGANINYQTGYAVFEATHGTAPLIAGQNKANPSAMLLSGAMLLDHLGWAEAAQRVRQSVIRTLSEGLMTGDLTEGKPCLGTKEFADAVLHRL
jgi:isocitrate dehydrogenase